MPLINECPRYSINTYPICDSWARRGFALSQKLRRHNNNILVSVNRSQLSGMIYAAVQKIALGYGQSLIFLFCEG